jgi:hypothetical protein
MRALYRVLTALRQLFAMLRAYRPAQPRLALGLLTGGMLGNYLWQWVPTDAQGDVAAASQALLIVGLLALVALAWQSFEVFAAAGLIAVYELQVAGCSIAYLFHPWPVRPGDEQCSALLGLPLGLIGALIGLYLAGYLYRAMTEPPHA